MTGNDDMTETRHERLAREAEKQRVHEALAEEVARLRAQNAELRSERDAWQQRAERMKLGNQCFERERDALKQQNAELLEALKDLHSGVEHLEVCRDCSMDSWSRCKGGRKVQSAVDKADAAIRRAEEGK